MVDKRSKRDKTIKHIIVARKNGCLGIGLIDPNNQQNCHVNGLVEILELLIHETKSGFDGLNNEMLKILNNFYL